MLAGRITGPQRLEFIDLPIPPAGESQVVVKLEVGSICGSDLPYFLLDKAHPSVAKEDLPLRPKLSLHELVGTIYQSRSQRFKEGDRVLAIPVNFEGLAEYFIANESGAVLLPSGPAEELVLSQPLGTVVSAHFKLTKIPGKTAVVLGQGPIGQLFCALLRHQGISKVIAIDCLRERLRLSAQMGATHQLSGTCDEIKAAVNEITNGKGADIVVEAAGKEESLNLSVALLSRGGQVVVFGLPCRHYYKLAINEFFYKEAVIINSCGPDPQVHFPIAIDLIVKRIIDVRPLITHRFGLIKTQEAMRLFASRSDGVSKIILQA